MRFVILTSLLAVVGGTYGMVMDYHSHYSEHGLNPASSNETKNGAIARPTIKRPRQNFPPISLDPSGNYVVSWEVDGAWITFQVTVATQGFIAFGISNDGKELGADIVAAEFLIDIPSLDFWDYHGELHKHPTEDTSQDWNFIGYSTEEGLTFLEFTRLLDTSDAAEDVIIEDKDTYLIWAISPTGSQYLGYHGSSSDTHGAYKINLLNPSFPTTPEPSSTATYEPETTTEAFSVSESPSTTVIPGTEIFCDFRKFQFIPSLLLALWSSAASTWSSL